MPPETSQKTDEGNTLSVAGAPATAASSPSAHAPSPSVSAPSATSVNTSPMPSALQPTDMPFNSLKPARDVWRLVWKAVIGLNSVISLAFIVFLVLKLTKLLGSTFSAGAVGTPFWLLPTLLVLDMAVLGVYFFAEHPKLRDMSKIAIWIGVSLLAVFVTSIAYVIVQSMA